MLVLSPALVEVIVMKPLLLTAVQPQLVPFAITTTLFDPPAEPKLARAVFRLNSHGAAPWVTVNVCPAMVIVPIRTTVFVLASTL